MFWMPVGTVLCRHVKLIIDIDVNKPEVDSISRLASIKANANPKPVQVNFLISVFRRHYPLTLSR